MSKCIKKDDLLNALNWDADLETWTLSEERLNGLPFIDVIPTSQTKWNTVKDSPPNKKGKYIVAYHPCIYDKILDEIEVGTDSFRGKNEWAKKKYQKVTHWMSFPEPPKEEFKCPSNCNCLKHKECTCNEEIGCIKEG